MFATWLGCSGAHEVSPAGWPSTAVWRGTFLDPTRLRGDASSTTASEATLDGMFALADNTACACAGGRTWQRERNTMVPRSVRVNQKGQEDRADERFRELTAWYTFQGIDEATARRRAREQMRDDDTD